MPTVNRLQQAKSRAKSIVAYGSTDSYQSSRGSFSPYAASQSNDSGTDSLLAPWHYCKKYISKFTGDKNVKIWFRKNAGELSLTTLLLIVMLYFYITPLRHFLRPFIMLPQNKEPIEDSSNFVLYGPRPTDFLTVFTYSFLYGFLVFQAMSNINSLAAWYNQHLSKNLLNRATMAISTIPLSILTIAVALFSYAMALMSANNSQLMLFNLPTKIVFIAQYCLLLSTVIIYKLTCNMNLAPGTSPCYSLTNFLSTVPLATLAYFVPTKTSLVYLAFNHAVINADNAKNLLTYFPGYFFYYFNIVSHIVVIPIALVLAAETVRLYVTIQELSVVSGLSGALLVACYISLFNFCVKVYKTPRTTWQRE